MIRSILPALRIHAQAGTTLVASSGYRILTSPDNGQTWEEKERLPLPPVKRSLSHSRIVSRALRMGVHQVREIRDGRFLIWCDGSVFLASRDLSGFTRVALDSPFFQVLDNSICVTPEATYYGEYIPNLRKEAVRIFRSRNGEDWEIVHEFAEKTIKHIHLLQADPFSGKIWFSSGDADAECLLGYADPDFSDVEIVGKGDQQWRCLELLFDPDTVYWGTDTPALQSRLIALDRRTGEARATSRFSGPVYNLKRFSEGFLALTATEGGRGEWYRRACLWYSPEIGSAPWNVSLSVEKDRWPFAFGFGRLLFGAAFAGSISLTGQALRGIDGKTLVISADRIRHGSG